MGALTGITVVDFSRILAGPYCTQTLADLGAEVWKIESPAGDETRHWVSASGTHESYFRALNRGKRSVVLNLKDPDDCAKARKMALQADVVVENFKVGTMARFGLDFNHLVNEHPGLIYASITGYGQTGPLKNLPGFDAAIQAHTGIMSLTGTASGEPTKIGVAWIDLATAQHTISGILAALFERSRTGRGRHLDFSLFDTGVTALLNVGQQYLDDGLAPVRWGNHHPQIVPYGTFKTRDSWLMICAGTDAQFLALCGVLGLEDWGLNFSTNPVRIDHREEVVRTLESETARRDAADLEAELVKVGVPASRVMSVPEVLNEAQTESRGLIWEVGADPFLGSPMGDLAQKGLVPPSLGEHQAAAAERFGF